jgi:hypothetical protein
MKKLIAIAALATAAIATPALAGTVSGEVRFGDLRAGRAGTTEYRVEAWDSVAGANVGAEVQVRQANHQGRLNTLISGKAGLNGPELAGVHTAAYVELGESLSQSVSTYAAGRTTVTGGNKTFWGAAAQAERTVYGPVSAVVGYRHREGFNSGAGRMNEQRLTGGLNLAINDATSVGATYYRNRGTLNSDEVGIGLNTKF